jgi:hypothetical protein
MMSFIRRSVAVAAALMLASSVRGATHKISSDL